MLEIAECGDVIEAFGGEPLPEPDAARLMSQVVNAIGYLHQRGITHRVRISRLRLDFYRRPPF